MMTSGKTALSYTWEISLWVKNEHVGISDRLKGEDDERID